jgi:peptidoglycan/xylan/chitin deacetylase (PgdA/CDA1 family)
MIRSLIVLVFCSSICSAQVKNPWNGKKCAVVLTYDDALNVHLDKAIPLLDSLHFRCTFYLSGYFPGCRDRLKDWSAAAKKGHELANHTLFHPCIGEAAGRTWVKPDYDLGTYTMPRLLDELRMTNILLESLDGKKQRTFAYPCGDTQVGGQSYVDQIKSDFVSARGTQKEMPKINAIDLYNVPSYGINGETGDQLIALVKQATNDNALLVFLFHGVGGEHNLNVSTEAHRQLLRYLKQHEDEIWVAPFLEVTQYVGGR